MDPIGFSSHRHARTVPPRVSVMTLALSSKHSRVPVQLLRATDIAVFIYLYLYCLHLINRTVSPYLRSRVGLAGGPRRLNHTAVQTTAIKNRGSGKPRTVRRASRRRRRMWTESPRTTAAAAERRRLCPIWSKRRLPFPRVCVQRRRRACGRQGAGKRTRTST